MCTFHKINCSKKAKTFFKMVSTQKKKTHTTVHITSCIPLLKKSSKIMITGKRGKDKAMEVRCLVVDSNKSLTPFGQSLVLKMKRSNPNYIKIQIFSLLPTM